MRYGSELEWSVAGEAIFPSSSEILRKYNDNFIKAFVSDSMELGGAIKESDKE